MKKHLLIWMTILSVSLFGAQADHLIFNKIAIAPTGAEMVVVKNPTDFDIQLGDYYITDATDMGAGEVYYNLPDGDDFWSGSISDFIARFPQMSLPAGESLTLSFHSSEVYSAYYQTEPDLALFGDMLHAIDGQNTISLGPNFDNIDMLNNTEVLILFHWDGSSATVEDADYFLWGTNDPGIAIDKTGVPGYADDTAVEDQYFMPSIENDMVYIRSSNEEHEEFASGGNGITGHDETSENFPLGWTVVFNPSLLATLSDIYNEVYPVGVDLVVQGLIVEFADIRPSNGPQIIAIEDIDGYRLDLTIWDWDVASSSIGYLVDTDSISEYVIQVKGTLDFYNGWQLEIVSPDNFVVYSVSHPNGQFVNEDIQKPKISPAPFVIIPSMGERLDFSYSFPSNSRVIIRIFDGSGRFVTTLVDQYFVNSGTVLRQEGNSEWDGRDHLGGIVPPGTYIMHIEASNFQTGKTMTDSAPVVVGVRF